MFSRLPQPVARYPPLWFFCACAQRRRRSELASAHSPCRLGTTKETAKERVWFYSCCGRSQHFFTTLSCLFSIECSPSTEGCRIFVQLRKPRLARCRLGR